MKVYGITLYQKDKDGYITYDVIDGVLFTNLNRAIQYIIDNYDVELIEDELIQKDGSKFSIYEYELI